MITVLFSHLNEKNERYGEREEDYEICVDWKKMKIKIERVRETESEKENKRERQRGR